MFLTAVHKHDPLNSNSENEHDAAIVWAEDVTTQSFRACVRELKNFDGIHKNVQVVSTTHPMDLLLKVTAGYKSEKFRLIEQLLGERTSDSATNGIVK